LTIFAFLGVWKFIEASRIVLPSVLIVIPLESNFEPIVDQVYPYAAASLAFMDSGAAGGRKAFFDFTLVVALP